MNGRRIQMPYAVDPDTGEPMPEMNRIYGDTPPPPTPPSAGERLFGPNVGPVADRLQRATTPSRESMDRFADAMGFTPEQKQRWFQNFPSNAPPPAQGSAPVVTRPEQVPPDQQVGAPGFGAPAAAPGGAPGLAGALGPGGVRTGMQKQTETETRVLGHPVSDEVRSAVEQAHIDQRLANQAHTDAEVAMGEKIGRFNAEQAAAQRTFLAYDQQERRRAEEKMGQLRTQLEADIQATREGKIDPQRRWNSLSTAQQIFATIGMALAEGAAIGSGGPNRVADRIMHSIDEDNRTQEADLARRGRAAEQQGHLLGMYREQYKDDTLARAAKRASDIEAARQELAALVTPDMSASAKAQAQAIDAQLEQRYAETLQHFDDAGADKVTVQSQAIMATGGKYGGGAGAGGGGVLNPKEETDANDLSKELVKSGIPEARSALNRLLSVVPEKGAIPGIGGIHGVASMAGGGAERADNIAYNFFGSKQGQEVRQAAQILFNKQLKDESGAAVTDNELERHKAAFYGARDADSARRALEAYGARLNAIEATIRSGHSDRVNAVQQQRQSARTPGPKTVTPVNPLGGNR